MARHTLLSGLLLCTVIMMSHTGHTKTFTVTTGSNNDCSDSDCDLQAAFNEAESNGEADTINVAAGNYDTSGSVFKYVGAAAENFALTITGAGADAATTILDGGSADQVMHIDLSGVTTDDAAHVSISGLTVQNGMVDGPGAGIRIQSAEANVTIQDCNFLDNKTDPANPNSGGGVSIVFDGGIGDATIKGNTFSGNVAELDGGGLNVVVGDVHLVEGNVFTNNEAKTGNGGAARVCCGDGPITFSKNTVSTNMAGNEGGGLEACCNDPGAITVSENQFTDNMTGSDGGGFRACCNDTGSITITGNTVTNNDAGEKGGGFRACCNNNTITISTNEVMSNDSGTRGGGIETCCNDDLITLTNNVVSHNDAVEDGGGVFTIAFNATRTLTNNTISQNTAQLDGGGLAIDLEGNASAAEIYNNIIYDNTATGEGQDIRINDDFDTDNTGAAVEIFNNDFMDLVLDCAGGCVPDVTQGDNIDADPLFADAAGGDFHLTSGSPAIDLGEATAPSIPAEDFEGDDRIDGDAPDMGADEFVDTDGDEVADYNDNCPNDVNNDQVDTDDDGSGDACESDDDGDGVDDGDDNCPTDANADQADTDDDGLGDVCDDSPGNGDGNGCALTPTNGPSHGNATGLLLMLTAALLGWQRFRTNTDGDCDSDPESDTEVVTLEK